MFNYCPLLSTALVLVSFVIGAADAPLAVEIKDVKKQSTLTITKTIKQANIAMELGKIYGAIGKYMKSKNLKSLSAPMAVYKSVSADEFEIEAGVVVAEGTQGEGPIKAGELSAGKTAFAVHVGPYDKLSETCDKINAFVVSKGLKGKGVFWEFYVSDPGNTQPGDLKTEIYAPLEKKQ